MREVKENGQAQSGVFRASGLQLTQRTGREAQIMKQRVGGEE
jgi:hypothetical protein